MFAVTLGAGKRIKGWIYVLLKGLNKVGYFCIDKLACVQISDPTHSLQRKLIVLAHYCTNVGFKFTIWKKKLNIFMTNHVQEKKTVIFIILC